MIQALRLVLCPRSTALRLRPATLRRTCLALADHSPDVLHVPASALSAFPPLRLLVENGPHLVGSTVAVDDASFTTRIRVHGGPAATAFLACVALSDVGSPQSINTSEAWDRMKRIGAVSTFRERVAGSRSWGVLVRPLPWKHLP